MKPESAKRRLALQTALYPAPVVLVSCSGKEGRPNIITIAWAGIVCSEPPMLSISVRPHRFSHKLISSSGEFVVNIPAVHQLRKVDICGTVSGRRTDKFKEMGFNAVASDKVKPPLIAECPVNIECRVKKSLSLGTHDIFIADIVAVHANEEVMDSGGDINYSLARPFVYNQGEYWDVGKKIGHYGFSKGKL